MVATAPQPFACLLALDIYDRAVGTTDTKLLPLAVPAKEWQPSDDVLPFFREAPELLEALRPARARNSWAMIYPSLVMVVPLDRSPDPK